MPSSQVANEEERAIFNDPGQESQTQVDEDVFMFAPKKPEGDLWEVALEPLMKREREQCDAWKEEVQNLLIFAGLFSAVVTAFLTAFVIESYKTLHVDPQDTMVFLLSNTLVRLENGTATSTPKPAGQISFMPDKSAERINSFWFISLVLSLATALIGIISLQWLREYQSYANFNSEETFALFNMRKDGLEKWHVPKVFAALPLLLQGALVLFLAGMVDFSLGLGVKVGIPVIIAITLTLAFLLLTTILPALQGISYLFRLPTTKGPHHLVPQCPYKSPQSRAFRVLALPIRAFWMATQRQLGALAWRLRPLYRFFVKPREAVTSSTPWIPDVNKEVLHRIVTRTTWSEYDQAWLQLRFNISQAIWDSVTKPGQLPTPYFYFTPYTTCLADLLCCLRRIMNSNVSETSMAAAYHCFLRVLLSAKHSIENVTSPPVGDLVYEYVNILIHNETMLPRLAKCLDMSVMSHSIYNALHYQTLTNFISIPGTPVWLHHYLELEILLQRWMYSDHPKLKNYMLARPGYLPDFVRTELRPFYRPNPSPDMPLLLNIHKRLLRGRPIAISSAPALFTDGLISQFCTIYVAYFTAISKGDQHHDWTTSTHLVPEISTTLLTNAACIGYHNLLAPTSIAIADIIIDCLKKHLDVLPTRTNAMATMIVRRTIFSFTQPRFTFVPSPKPFPWTPSIRSVYETLEEARMVLVRYKARVLDVVGPDQAIERRFADYYDSRNTYIPVWELDVSQIPRRFSAEWWSFLEVPFVSYPPSQPGGEVVRMQTPGEPDGVPMASTLAQASSVHDLPSTSDS